MSVASFSAFQPWKKLLYIRQDYPDNYVDESFLEQMQKNVNVRTHYYWTVAHRTCAVTQHISSIMVFTAIFVHLYSGLLSPTTLLMITAVSVFIGYAIWDIIVFRQRLKTTIYRGRIFKSAALLFAILVGLTPILKTLTKEISSDTVWTLTVMMILANLVFHDYSAQDVLRVRYW
ncbi:phosphatidylinositol N-acetylglucosaminyltransferase [Spizellomyces sp. 'palustris']|nr:phosphatidylinositol N-acetylglucosaminyltransferase [Spizellomyces sp. 'palustris']